MMFVAKEPVETLVDYRRFGSGSGLPLLFLQHFTGTLDNWDPAVTDALASGREVILFESAGLGRSTGKVPDTIGGMAKHIFPSRHGLSRKREAMPEEPHMRLDNEIGTAALPAKRAPRSNV